MSSTVPIYRHQGGFLFGILLAIFVVVLVYLFFGVAEIAFERIGFSREEFVIILALTFIGSFINIPVTRITNVENMVDYREVRVFWVTYRIPQSTRKQISTLVIVNVGGAIVPTIVSLFLLVSHPSLLGYAAVGLLVSSVIVHLVARRERGVGIVTPAFIPPIAAAIISLLIAPASGAAIIAYVSGSMGALIGADLTNLRGITKLGAPVVSIGGAGTFDGVFLTGIMAVLIVSIH
ncbi:MAG: DUF1614 domain-containing protein [Thaumarchaeota archaeon]|nr:DUF1614 domain-containing protein [Nitrososphaerota archaeon]